MKQSVWGYAAIVLGVVAIMITWFFTQVTNTDQHNYNLLKETVESSMYDALDLSAYRKDGTIRIEEAKFVESFLRRFSENGDLSNSYKIYIYDINEGGYAINIDNNNNIYNYQTDENGNRLYTGGPKVSLKIVSLKDTSGATITGGEKVTFSINNNIDAVLETLHEGEEPGKHSVTFYYQDQNGTTNTVKVEDGLTVVAPKNVRWADYQLQGWYTDPGYTQKYNFATPIKSDLSLYAKWNVNTYQVTFLNNNGTTTKSEPVPYWGYLPKPTNPTKEHYIFNHWSTNQNCSTTYDFNTHVTGDFTLWACYEPRKYKLTFKANAGQATVLGMPSAQTVTYNPTTGKATAPANPTRTDGYELKYWSTSTNGNAFDFSKIITQDVVLYAVWKDVQPPRCEAKKSGDSEFGVTVNITCYDNSGSCKLIKQGKSELSKNSTTAKDTNVKYTTTYTVVDFEDNTSTCSVSPTPYSTTKSVNDWCKQTSSQVQDTCKTYNCTQYENIYTKNVYICTSTTKKIAGGRKTKITWAWEKSASASGSVSVCASLCPNCKCDSKDNGGVGNAQKKVTCTLTSSKCIKKGSCKEWNYTTKWSACEIVSSCNSGGNVKCTAHVSQVPITKYK